MTYSDRRRAPLWPLLAFVFVVALLASTLTLALNAASSSTRTAVGNVFGHESRRIASEYRMGSYDGAAVRASQPEATSDLGRTDVSTASPATAVLARTTSVEDIPAIITAAALEFGVDPGLLQRVAWCESSYRADVLGDAGASVGLWQIQAAFWWENAPRIGYTTDLRLDPIASSRVAAYAFSVGKARAWTCRG